MKKENIALGFYQELSTVKTVISSLEQRNITRFATIHRKRDHTLEINKYLSRSTLLFVFACLSASACLLILKYLSLIDLPWLPVMIAIMTMLAIAGACALWNLSRAMGSDIINRFKNLVIVDEILLLVQVNQSEVREVLSALRDVKSGHPVTFLLRPDRFEEKNIEIPSEPMTIEQQRQEASKLAFSLLRTSNGVSDNHPFIKGVQKSSQLLQFLRRDIADAEYIEQTVPSSAEWLLDNMYVLEGSIEDVKLNIPKKYYKELPKIVDGPFTGLPRIYALAIQLVNYTVGGLNNENITNFLESYQIDHPLTIGELWAFPLMLRFRLIEWIEFLAIHVDNRMREGELASFWGNRLLYAARHDPSKLPIFLTDLAKENTSFSGHFAEELLDHLFDEEALLLMVRQWLEERFESPLDEILRQEHLDETSEQIVFSNSIRSLITLSQLSWPEIFEVVSPVDAILRNDYGKSYSRMDFTTRNSYRATIEQIARRVDMTEVDIAKKALSISEKGRKEFEKHVGYYLIDDGRQVLEKMVGYRAPFLERYPQSNYQTFGYGVFRGNCTHHFVIGNRIIFLSESFRYRFS